MENVNVEEIKRRYSSSVEELKKIKIALLLSAVSQLCVILSFKIGSWPEIIQDIVIFLWLGLMIAGYVAMGGSIFKSIARFFKKLAFWGFAFPFPASLIFGCVSFFGGISIGLIVLVYFPLLSSVVIYLNKRKVIKTEIDDLSLYLSKDEIDALCA